MNSVANTSEIRSLSEIEADFAAVTGLLPKKNIKASNCTTFRIGGEFEYYIEPNSTAQLSSAIKYLNAKGLKINILGAGSNVLADSAGVKGWTLHLGRAFKSFEKLEGHSFRVGAAYSLTSLARELSQAGYSGLEFAAGIPASIGGAVRMNAGAHAGEISTVLSAIEIIDEQGVPRRLNMAELSFGYRSCSLPSSSIVIAAEFCLKSSDAETVMTQLSTNLDYRKKTQPLTQPSAGSVFRNPGHSKEMSAGAIIEKLGLKGQTQGSAQISNLHANWIVNLDKTASSEDVKKLIDLCKQQAEEKLSQTLQTEIVMW